MGAMNRQPPKLNCMLLKIIFLRLKTKYRLSLKQVCLNNNPGIVMNLKYLMILTVSNFDNKF